jgi:hypothetical protein
MESSGVTLCFPHEATPETDPAGGAYMHNRPRVIRVRIAVILDDLMIVIDLEIS